jgi:hypothetical protein
MALGATLPVLLPTPVAAADDKPSMGAPLGLSNIETEQPVPMAYLLPDGKTAKCAEVRLHWISQPDVGEKEDAASFTLDLPADNPAAPVFTAQLWSASLASAMAWQQPWQGARWKILDTPVTDGTGLDASLAVGMISTSARRPYPKTTVVIGSLNPDGSLGPVSHLVDRINAAAKAGMTRVIIPSVQRFDTDASGQVINIVRHAGELHLECVPVDDLISATQTTMNDPLPDATLDTSLPKYSDEVASYIDDFAHREQAEATSGLKFAPKEADLGNYPGRSGTAWKSVYADYEAGQEAYRAGQVYVAYQLFARANGRMNGANALAGQSRTTFDVKTALAESDELHDRLQTLMTPPTIDKGDLQSAVLVAEMADWAYEVRASLEGAQLVTKQAFSQRTDATDAEKDRARESILFANAQSKYLLTQADFYTGLLGHVAKGSPINVDLNASHLLPQLIPAQLAAARSFTSGIRASDLRDGLLFDPRLVAYVNVLRQWKADWDARQRKKAIESQDTSAAPTPTTTTTDAGPVKLNNNAPSPAVGFDPGTTYQPPHTVVDAASAKKLSDPAQCLIWVNNDCEIATLDEKYLRLNGSMDPTTHDWRVKDRPKLDALLQMAEIGARRGISFGSKAEIDPSILAMIYERAAYQRQQASDATALDSLRNFWRCALLGNMCWQLAHTHKAEAVDLSSETNVPNKAPPAKKGDKKADDTTTAKTGDEHQGEPAPNSSASTNSVTVVTPHGSADVTNPVVTPATTNATTIVHPPQKSGSVATKVTENAPPPEPTPTPNPPPAPAPTPAPEAPPAPAPMPVYNTDDSNIPVAPIAHAADVNPTPVPSSNVSNTPTPPAPTPLPIPPPTPAPAATNVASHPAPPAPLPNASTPTPPDDANIPVAPVARVEDYSNGNDSPSVHPVSGHSDMPTATNAAPIGPVPPSPSVNKPDNADAHANGFP